MSETTKTLTLALMVKGERNIILLKYAKNKKIHEYSIGTNIGGDTHTVYIYHKFYFLVKTR